MQIRDSSHLEATQSSDRIIISRHNETVVDFQSRAVSEPIELMSVTKSLVGVLVCRLVQLGLLSSLDVPIYEFYPEWKQGLKKFVSIRHILAHSSCLKADRTTEEIYRASNFVELALSSELVAVPGSRFFYNNKAVNILSGVIEIVSGQKMDSFAKHHLFDSLGIDEFHWRRDGADNPHAMAGLSLKGEDLLKVGQLMLNQGKWGHAEILSCDLVRSLTSPGQGLNESCGLLWWRVFDSIEFFYDARLLQEYSDAGIDPYLLRPLEAILNQHFAVSGFRAVMSAVVGGEAQLDKILHEIYTRQLPMRRLHCGQCIGFKATGYLGQELVVLPQYSIVGVRQVRWDTAERFGGRNTLDFERLLLTYLDSSA